MRSGSSWSEEFVKQLEDDEFREEYVADRVRTRLALLIRAIRENPDREWSQSVFAEKLGKRQSAVSRLEDPDYGKFTLHTLLEVAAAFKLPLYVDFPEWDEWMRLMKDVPTDALRRQGFDVGTLCKPIQDSRIEDELRAIFQGSPSRHSRKPAEGRNKLWDALKQPAPQKTDTEQSRLEDMSQKVA